MTDIRSELAKFKGQTGERRRKYFHWKNGIDTLRTSYSTMSEEDFISWACQGIQDRFNRLVRWEESDRYKELIYILHSDNFDNDIVDVYNALKNEALKGNSTAVKTMIDVQREITERLNKQQEPIIEEDDGLTLEI